MDKTMSEEELRWQRRSDARTLAEAEQIMADKERYRGAIIGAKEIASKQIKEVQSIAKVAGMKAPKEPSGRNTSIPSKKQPFGNVRYPNPATIGRF